jgi:hypothetical protein
MVAPTLPATVPGMPTSLRIHFDPFGQVLEILAETGEG